MNYSQYFCNLDQAYLMAINTLKIRTISNYPKVFNSPGYLNDQFLIYIEHSIITVLYIHTNYQVIDRKYQHSEFEIWTTRIFEPPLTINVKISDGDLLFTRKVMI
jgi:hypothetical protein